MLEAKQRGTVANERESDYSLFTSGMKLPSERVAATNRGSVFSQAMTLEFLGPSWEAWMMLSVFLSNRAGNALSDRGAHGLRQ